MIEEAAMRGQEIVESRLDWPTLILFGVGVIIYEIVKGLVKLLVVEKIRDWVCACCQRCKRQRKQRKVMHAVIGSKKLHKMKSCPDLKRAKKDVENAEAVRLKMVSVLDELVQAAERDLKTRVHASLRTLDAARDAADEKVAVLKAAIVTAGAPASATRADE